MPLNLLDLHLELIYIILEYVHNSSPHTTRSVARVNKYLHDAARVIRNRRRTLSLGNQFRSKGLDAKECDWMRDTIVLNSIRHLTINDPSRQNAYKFKDDVVYLDLILELIERIGNLKSLTWNIGPMSKRILKTLGEKHPNAKLRIFNYWRRDPSIDHLTEDEVAVCTFKKLTDFRAVVIYENHYGPVHWNENYCIDVYKHMIASSRSLQYAGIGDPSPGHGVSTPATIAPDPTTHVVKRNRCESLRNLTLDTRGLDLSKGLLDDWNDIVNIAQLETLKLVRGQPMLDYFQSAATMLPNIKHVSLNFASMLPDEKNELPKAANQYLLKCSPLTSLSIWNVSQFVDMEELIHHHSPTIEVLQIHHNELYNDRPELPLQTIALMREKCLKLRDLTLDFNRKDYKGIHPPFERVALTLSDNQSALAILDEIALFGTRLDKVQFYVENINANLERSLQIWPDGTIQPAANTNDDSDSDSGSDYDQDYDDDDDDDDDGDDEVDNDDDNDNNGEGEADEQEDEAEPEPAESATPQNVPYQPVPWDDLMQGYVEDIWKRVFGAQDFGDRAVDVKFGEWESKFIDHRYGNRRWFEVRPHERDDRPGDCFTKVTKPGSQHR